MHIYIYLQQQSLKSQQQVYVNYFDIGSANIGWTSLLS